MKQIILFTGLLLISAGVFAQETVQLSFSTGPSVNWMSSGKNDLSGGNIRAGYDFGVVADVYFDSRQRYALTTGFLLANTGGELEYHNSEAFDFGETINPGSSMIFHLKYIEVPLAVKLKTSQFRRWTFWGQFGLSGFVNVGAKGDTNDGVLDKTDIQDEIRSLNMAMNLGFGGDFDLGSGNALAVGLILKDGLTDVTKNHYNDGKITVNSVNLKLALIF